MEYLDYDTTRYILLLSLDYTKLPHLRDSLTLLKLVCKKWREILRSEISAFSIGRRINWGGIIKFSLRQLQQNHISKNVLRSRNHSATLQGKRITVYSTKSKIPILDTYIDPHSQYNYSLLEITDTMMGPIITFERNDAAIVSLPVGVPLKAFSFYIAPALIAVCYYGIIIVDWNQEARFQAFGKLHSKVLRTIEMLLMKGIKAIIPTIYNTCIVSTSTEVYLIDLETDTFLLKEQGFLPLRLLQDAIFPIYKNNKITIYDSEMGGEIGSFHSSAAPIIANRDNFGEYQICIPPTSI